MAGRLEPFLRALQDGGTAMQELVHIDTEALAREALRYLAAVDAFRAERCEPVWRPELVPSAAPQPASLTGPGLGQRGATRRQA